MDLLNRFFSPRRERAAALIIVLAFVVLLTGLVIAYFSRATSDRPVAQSSFNQSKADQLAQSAMDNVIGDLRQEIVNGSSPSPTPTPTTSPIPSPTPTPFVYFPTPIANMLPVRSAPNTIPNLIHRSVYQDAIPPPAVASRASNVNSTVASVNGRSITLARWNKHYLIPRPSGTDPSVTTPISDFAAPDWVFVTNTGATVITQPSTSVIGRYAYAIYDESGLLDVNVAGFPFGTTAPQFGPKGPSAFADLTVLGLSQGGIDAIAGWRGYGSTQPTGAFGSFPNFTFTPTFATRYVNNFVLSNTNGFIAVGTNTSNNQTDQAFTTRQALIQLRARIGETAFPANALQYLTTFSRELNAPSWKPTQDASDMGGNNGTGNVYAYKTNADSSTAINRNLLGVQVVNSFTRPDGTTAVVGEPLIKRRFPLTRLAGVGPTGIVTAGNSTIINGVPSVATPATVQRDFGLQWDGSSPPTPPNNRWNYVGASTTGAIQPRILTLDEVAKGKVLDATGNYVSTLIYREPNFFELLKAVILSGSVGMGSGSANTFVASDPKYYITGTTPSNLLSADYQIMQIGANIINQWDSGNVPIFFYFGNPASELAGIKNLPYLNKLVFKPAWTKVQGKDVFAAWLLPSLWNPHQNAPPLVSQNVQIAMTAGTMTASITSTGNTTLSSPNVAAPQLMTVDASAFGISPSAPTAVVGNPSSSITKSTDGYYGFNFTFVNNPLVTPSNSSKASPNFAGSPLPNFELQVQVGTAWKSYQKWTGCSQVAPLICQPPASTWTQTTNPLQDPEFVILDPRTLRFGVWGNAYNQSGAPADYTNGTQYTLDSPPTEAITALVPQGTTWFTLSTAPYALYNYANNTSSTVHYTDLDLVQRLGDFTTSGTTDEMQVALSTDRPLMLSGAFRNGVFQSVAELGHVFRDQPWKTLNFTTASPNTIVKSADFGLLDIFTLHESSMEAGKTSFNTRQKPILTAILSKATKQLADQTGATQINSGQQVNVVNALFNITSAQPAIRKTDLLAQLAADPSVTILGNKEARELVMRAFSDACQTRTWNLMIDVVAQSGRYPSNASTLAGFLVEGEQHYWVHVAIDRLTGQVIDKQIEVVNE